MKKIISVIVGISIVGLAYFLSQQPAGNSVSVTNSQPAPSLTTSQPSSGQVQRARQYPTPSTSTRTS